jgi:hypothetical protein
MANLVLHDKIRDVLTVQSYLLFRDIVDMVGEAPSMVYYVLTILFQIIYRIQTCSPHLLREKGKRKRVRNAGGLLEIVNKVEQKS